MRKHLSSSNPVVTGLIPKLICGAMVALAALCASAESKHLGYWLHGKTMKDVDVPSLVSLGTTDVFLHEYAFTAHGQKDVAEWIAQADAAGLNVHIWMQVFYNGKWINPVKDGAPDRSLFDEKIARAQSYARMRGVAGIHFDYVRYPGTAYKTPGGADAVSEFVRLAATQIHQTSPRLVVSAALMPETTANLHYYGQDYAALTKYLDVVVPMIYKGNYKKTTSWIEETARWFVKNSKGAKVWAGLQGYKSDEDTSKLPISEITADFDAALKAGTDGAVIFRWGVSSFVVFTAKWRDDLYLGRGGLWKCRVPITVTNPTAEACEGQPVALKVGKDLPIAKVRLEELRLVDDKGNGLLFGAWDDKRIENGPLPDGTEISIPVSLPANGTATYWLYWDNPSAWGYADFFKKRAKPGTKVGFKKVGATERISAAFAGHDAAWPADPADGAWVFRVPIRMANFSSEDIPSALASFNLHEAVRATRNADCKLMDGATELPLCVLDDRAIFTCQIPAQTVKTCWLYVRQGKPRPQEKPEAARSALGSPIPSDQVLLRKTTVSDVAAYERILKSSANLVKNPCFTGGSAGWTHTKETKGSRIAYETPKTGGKFGGGFAKTTIPADEKPVWRGWYHHIPIKSNRSYFYGGFISSDNSDSRVSIHLHKHGRDGHTTSMLMTSGGVVGTTPWTPTFGAFSTDDNDASISLHLTTQGHGSFAYDGIIVAEYARALVGAPQARPAGPQVALAVQSVDPIVKVFRESPVEDSHAFEIRLAQNETEPLQLAVRAEKAIGRLEVEVTPPAMADGTGGLAVETGWVEYVPVDFPSSYFSSLTPEWTLKHPKNGAGSDGWSGWWPDPIAPVNFGPVAANVTQPVWINVKSSATTKPGVYTGRIMWKADGKVIRTDMYTVRVWNFALPTVAETPAIYDLRLGSKWWKNDFEGLDADGRRRLLWKFNSKKRICPDSLCGELKFTRAADGTITADFKEYDRLASEYFDEFHFPVSYTPRVFYCFGWAMPPKKFLGEDPYPGKWPYDGADRTQLRPEYKKAYQAALRLYWDHMKAKGWADKLVLYISDEPHFTRQEIKTQMIACCKMIHEVDPSIRIYSSTWRHCPEWNDSIDVWGVGHYGNFPVDEMKARAAAGKHIWFTTDGQMCLDTPYCAIERMLPHYCAAHHAEAYEFWGSTWLTYDPWKFGWHSYISQTDTPGKHYFVRYPDGDGYLIYPGVPGRFKGPITSVRLEAARDGVEDFSYLKRLERLAAGNDARAARAKTLLAEFRALVTIPNAGGRYSTRILPEPEKIGILRRAAGDLLSER